MDLEAMPLNRVRVQRVRGMVRRIFLNDYEIPYSAGIEFKAFPNDWADVILHLPASLLTFEDLESEETP